MTATSQELTARRDKLSGELDAERVRLKELLERGDTTKAELVVTHVNSLTAMLDTLRDMIYSTKQRELNDAVNALETELNTLVPAAYNGRLALSKERESYNLRWLKAPTTGEAVKRQADELAPLIDRFNELSRMENRIDDARRRVARLYQEFANWQEAFDGHQES